MLKVKRRLFGTLFDRNYAAKGYAMLRSLEPYTLGRPIELAVLALDDWTERALHDKSPAAGLKVHALPEFEKAMNLGAVRQSRPWREYCWTLASQFASFLMDTYPDADQVTYLDADLFFFSDILDTLRMIGEASVAVAPHRFDEAHAHYAKNGRYNVGWVSFRRDDEGQACLREWAGQVRQHCSRDPGPHGLGDQGYLDHWPSQYPRFREIGHPGVDLGPWSLEDVEIGPGPTVDGLPVVSYHFHEFHEEEAALRLTYYPLSQADLAHLYRPYVFAYQAAKSRLGLGESSPETVRLLWRQR